MVDLVNLSLSAGSAPTYFKRVVQPLLKKSNLDLSLPENYRPISKLPFFSVILEKLISFLERHSVFDKFQSGFRKLHSAETGPYFRKQV